MVLVSPFLSLKRKEELRPTTLSPLICARAAINSSDNQSEKYSSFGSPLSLTSGRTAIDFCEGVGAAVIWAVDVDLLRTRGNIIKPVATMAIATMRAANLRALRWGIYSLGAMSSARFTPCGVISKAQAMM